MTRLARLARVLDVAAGVIAAAAEIAVATAGALQTASTAAAVADHQIRGLRQRIIETRPAER